MTKIKENSKLGDLKLNNEDLRWATNEIVADYRAKKLKCNIITDIGCGIGFQTFSFAKECTKVYAIEINRDKLEKVKENAKKLGFKNIEFIYGDALDEKIIEKIKDSDIIFCDTERPETEKERNIENIKPNISKLLHKYKKITSKIAIEFPPQIQEINLDCEKEYISLNGKLNRLTLYFGELKNSECSAVILPSKKILRGNPEEKNNFSEIKKYIYEIDPSVVKAKLVNELIKLTKTNLIDTEKKNFLTSEERIENDFFKNSYEILNICNFDKASIIKNLKKLNAKEVEIRFSVNPKDYWKIRKEYELNLNGNKKLTLFNFQKKAIIANPII